MTCYVRLNNGPSDYLPEILKCRICKGYLRIFLDF